MPSKIKEGSSTNHISVFYDFFQTACDVAQIENKFKTDGVSYYPTLIGKKQIKHKYLYWEYPASGGLQAIRIGNWKGIKRDLFKRKSKIELYNLLEDPKELNDLADEFPQIVTKMENFLKEAHTTPYLDNFIIPLLE